MGAFFVNGTYGFAFAQLMAKRSITLEAVGEGTRGCDRVIYVPRKVSFNFDVKSPAWYNQWYNELMPLA